MQIRGSPNGARHSPPHLSPPGRDRSERVVAINWNRWSPSIGAPNCTYITKRVVQKGRHDRFVAPRCAAMQQISSDPRFSGHCGGGVDPTRMTQCGSLRCIAASAYAPRHASMFPGSATGRKILSLVTPIKSRDAMTPTASPAAGPPRRRRTYSQRRNSTDAPPEPDEAMAGARARTDVGKEALECRPALRALAVFRQDFFPSAIFGLHVALTVLAASISGRLALQAAARGRLPVPQVRALDRFPCPAIADASPTSLAAPGP
jgi:hypothetical protein